MQLNVPEKLMCLARRAPFPLYVVGGAVRDALAGLPCSQDWDLCAPADADVFSALAEECGLHVAGTYKNTGTVNLTDGERKMEFTRFRKDVYRGGEHAPAQVSFTDSIEEDARRRDFRCNAVYYDIARGEIADPLGGVADIDARVLETTRDADEVFSDVMSIIRKQKVAAEELSAADVITYFSGVRAATYEEDFVVRKGIFTENVIETAGIQSPGITAAPAIACDVRDWVKEMLGAKDKKDFDPVRKHTPRLAGLSPKEREEYIRRDPAYGEIVCRCEEVSKGEIIDALDSPLKVCTVDGIKRRVRPGMGRCQGGFCSPLVVKIIAEHEGMREEDVLKGDEGSFILYGDTKKGGEADK